MDKILKEIAWKALEKDPKLREHYSLTCEGFAVAWEERELTCEECGSTYDNAGFGAHYDSILESGVCCDCFPEYMLKVALIDCENLKVTFDNMVVNREVRVIEDKIKRAIKALGGHVND